MSVTVAPHGLWKSPISGDSFTARSVTLSQVRVDGPDTYWVEGHPRQGGRGTLLRRRATGETGEVLPLIDGSRLPDVGTRVHEYGGKAYAVHHGVIVFSDQTDGRVYAFDTADPRRVVRPLRLIARAGGAGDSGHCVLMSNRVQRAGIQDFVGWFNDFHSFASSLAVARLQ